jgi:hypothetical protein
MEDETMRRTKEGRLKEFLALPHGNYYDFVADVIGFINETAEDYNHDFRIGLKRVDPRGDCVCGVSRSHGRKPLERESWQDWTTLEAKILRKPPRQRKPNPWLEDLKP